MISLNSLFASPSTMPPDSSTPLLPGTRASRLAATGRRKRGGGFPVYVLPAVLLTTLFVVGSLAVLTCTPRWVCSALRDNGWKKNCGPYSPYVDLGSGERLPHGCHVDQVSILHRHTGRYPTKAHAKRLQVTLDKLAARKAMRPPGSLAFLFTANLSLDAWDLGELTEKGRRSAWQSGRAYGRKYPSLRPEAFSRSAGGSRVVESARYFLAGFGNHEMDKKLPMPDLVIPEGSNVNNTLCVHNCPGFSNSSPHPGEIERRQIQELLRPAATRINDAIGPDPPFDPLDVVHVANMCGFVVAQTKGRAVANPWCHVLTRAEWDAVGYAADVERWYHVGEGSPYSRVMGSGWVNELLARLQDTTPEDNTSTNRTLDSDPKTFPRGGKRLFIDFSHDNEMIEILTALGVHRVGRPLPTDHLPTTRTRDLVRLAHLIPFGARWEFERIQCTGQPFVRILINNRPVGVNDPACVASRFAERRMCALSAFVESQAFARSATWDACSVETL